MAVTNRLDDDVSILLGIGGGTFGAATNFAAGTGPYSASIADLNGAGNQAVSYPNLTHPTT